MSLQRFVAAFSLACLCAGQGAARAPGAANATLYLAHEGGRWCAYSRKSAWSAAVSRAQASEVGEIDFVAGVISKVTVTVEAESGDWIVSDQYRLIGGGVGIDSLSREVRFAEGDVRVREHYRIENGGARRDYATRIDPRDEKPMPGRLPDYLPDVPIAAKPAQLPFYSLLQVPGIREKQKTCASGD